MLLSPTKQCQGCSHSVSCQTEHPNVGEMIWGPKPAASKQSWGAPPYRGMCGKQGLVDQAQVTPQCGVVPDGGEPGAALMDPEHVG